MPLSESEAIGKVRELRPWHESERSKLDGVRLYWKGRQHLPGVIPHAAPREVREMLRMSRVNICDIVVGSLAQSLFVDGFRVPRTAANESVWDTWQANRMDMRQSGITRAALAYGASYAVVLPRVGGRQPAIRGLSPRRLFAVYGDDPDWPVWALERVSDTVFRLYDDEAAYPVDLSDRDRPEAFDAEPHGAGVVPVVRFLDEVDLDVDDEPPPQDWHGLRGGGDRIVAGQVAPLVPVQDQIDLTTFGLLVAQHYSAFRQRYAIGWVADSEQKMAAAASQLWTFENHPDDMRLGEFDQTSLDGYINSREASLRHGATLSQTPVHELIGQMINLSSDALAAAEAGRDRKVDERKTSLGESYEQALWLVGRYTGVDVPDDAEVIWRDTSARAFGAVVDGLGKLAQMLGVPVEALWERVPGVTQQDVERWRELAAEGGAVEQMTAQLRRQDADVDPAVAGGADA